MGNSSSGEEGGGLASPNILSKVTVKGSKADMDAFLTEGRVNNVHIGYITKKQVRWQTRIGVAFSFELLSTQSVVWGDVLLSRVGLCSLFTQRERPAPSLALATRVHTSCGCPVYSQLWFCGASKTILWQVIRAESGRKGALFPTETNLFFEQRKQFPQ